MSRITESRELANGVVTVLTMMLGPFLFVMLYWARRCKYRSNRMNSDESRNISRVSGVMSLSSLPCFIGVFAWQKNSFSVSAIGLGIFGVFMAYSMRLLWRLYRSKYERMIAEGLLSDAPQQLRPEQRKSLFVAIVLAIFVSVLGWTGIYFFFRGSILLGVSLPALGALLCQPMIRKLRQAVVLNESPNQTA